MKNSLEIVLSQDGLFRNTHNRPIIVIFDTREGRPKGGKKTPAGKLMEKSLLTVAQLE